MSLTKYIPSSPEIIREVIVVLTGALIATLIVKSLPAQQQGIFNFLGNNQQ